MTDILGYQNAHASASMTQVDESAFMARVTREAKDMGPGGTSGVSQGFDQAMVQEGSIVAFAVGGVAPNVIAGPGRGPLTPESPEQAGPQILVFWSLGQNIGPQTKIELHTPKVVIQGGQFGQTFGGDPRDELSGLVRKHAEQEVDGLGSNKMVVKHASDTLAQKIVGDTGDIIVVSDQSRNVVPLDISDAALD